MARNTVVLDVAPDVVFAVLCDPGAYRSVVVGTRSVRRFDPSWPEVGAVLHHSLGIGPLVLRDKTEVLEMEEGRRLVLRAQVRPLGVNRVTFVLSAVGAGTRVVVHEEAIEGPAAAVWNPVLDAMMAVRNRVLLGRLRAVTLRRLRRQAEVQVR